ncbi:MAG: CrcB family protein [Microbacteriaceae bacterium]
MIDYTWIAVQVLFGAFGATARFGVMNVVPPGKWSWGLFTVNMGGSLFVGTAVGALTAGALDWSIAALVIAFAAGFTTFSTLTLTAAEWTERGEMWRGLTLAAKQVLLGVAIAGVGYISAEVLLRA